MNTDGEYAVYFCNTKAKRNVRKWEFFTSVEGYARALLACKLLRGTGRGAQAVRIDPNTIRLAGPGA